MLRTIGKVIYWLVVLTLAALFFVGGGFIASIIILIVGLLIKQKVSAIRHMKTCNYDWYCAHYPENIDNGRVSCFSCGGRRISLQRMMNNTYTNAHVCRNCGTTLFYSPE